MAIVAESIRRYSTPFSKKATQRVCLIMEQEICIMHFLWRIRASKFLRPIFLNRLINCATAWA